ncbi:MAG TPA: hypothetical protein EYP33_05245 [Pyrodictium sp.]|nr:hypothetical protein [Pyrodictium sp.]
MRKHGRVRIGLRHQEFWLHGGSVLATAAVCRWLLGNQALPLVFCAPGLVAERRVVQHRPGYFTYPRQPWLPP